MIRYALILTALFVPQLAPAAVWKTTNRWDANWEARYVAWVGTDWKVDIFRNPKSPYYGLYPDCADSVYSMRAIFASQNGLPFAITDPSTQRSTISNEISKFDNVPEGGRRVTAFLGWLYNLVGTPNLPSDTYPVALRRGAVRPGGLMLAKESKHSYTIKALKDTGVPVLYYSTQANRGNLKVRSWPSVGYLFSAGIKQPSGIRDFRLPEDLLKPVWEVPGYSDEQYKIPAAKWTLTVQARLAQRRETSEEALRRQMDDACQLVTTRVDLVNDALAKQKSVGGRCFNAAEYDDYSTPSRDGQTKAAFTDLATTLHAALGRREVIDPTLLEQLKNIYADDAGDEGGAQFCQVRYAADKRMTLGEFRRRLFTGRISANPNETLGVRWGDQKGPSDHAKACPVY